MIEIVEEDKDRIVVNIKGKTHGFCNILRKELLEDKHVKIAAYRVEHPLVNVSRMIIETDGKKKPRAALVEASKRLKNVAERIKKEFIQATKQI